MNFPILLAAAVIPLLIGFVWYHPKVFGAAWMKAAGVADDGTKPNMILVFGLTYVFSFLVAFMLTGITIHQTGAYSMLVGMPGFDAKAPDSEAWQMFSALMAKFGNNYRTFKHGALHGTIAGIGLALPIVGVTALFERKGFKYIAINTGYWIVAFALMGGVVCQWGLNPQM